MHKRRLAWEKKKNIGIEQFIGCNGETFEDSLSSKYRRRILFRLHYLIRSNETLCTCVYFILICKLITSESYYHILLCCALLLKLLLCLLLKLLLYVYIYIYIYIHRKKLQSKIKLRITWKNLRGLDFILYRYSIKESFFSHLSRKMYERNI